MLQKPRQSTKRLSELRELCNSCLFWSCYTVSPAISDLLEALISELDPVFGAMKLAKLNTTGALNLVTEFLDGSALTYVALVNDIAKAPCCARTFAYSDMAWHVRELLDYCNL